MTELVAADELSEPCVDLDDPIILQSAFDALGRVTSRVAPLLTRAKKLHLDRDQLHLLLEAVCDLREASKIFCSQPSPDDVLLSQAAAHGREIAQVILEQIAEWTELDASHSATDGIFVGKVSSNRPRLAAFLIRAPSLLPDSVRTALAKSLRDLENGSGELPELFTPSQDLGKGARPKEARSAREYLCYWIRWAQGSGMTRESAIDYVAQLSGTPKQDAVKKWLEGVEKIEEKRPALERFRQDGRAGIPFLQGSITPQGLADILHHARQPRKAYRQSRPKKALL
jgi:hypothetical protein